MKNSCLKLMTLLLPLTIFASEDPTLITSAKNLLSYDPKITLVPEIDPGVVNTGRPTVYLHGFGANRQVADDIKRFYGSKRLPGDIYTFDFIDAAYDKMDTSKSSLGQWRDIKTALYVLKKAQEAGVTQVGINAHSRGGATAVNMVAMLADRTEKYRTQLAEVGIDDAQRAEILAMLQRGHIVLECPLISVRTVIKHQVESSGFGSSLKSLFGRRLASSSVDSSVTSLDYAAPLVVKEYRPGAAQAMKSAEAWNGAKIPTIVHFQAPDEVLGNERDREFFAKLQESNGAACTYVHQGFDGGHNSSFASFDDARNDFLRRHGASYKPLDGTRK